MRDEFAKVSLSLDQFDSDDDSRDNTDERGTAAAEFDRKALGCYPPTFVKNRRSGKLRYCDQWKLVGKYAPQLFNWRKDPSYIKKRAAFEAAAARVLEYPEITLDMLSTGIQAMTTADVTQPMTLSVSEFVSVVDELIASGHMSIHVLHRARELFPATNSALLQGDSATGADEAADEAADPALLQGDSATGADEATMDSTLLQGDSAAGADEATEATVDSALLQLDSAAGADEAVDSRRQTMFGNENAAPVKEKAVWPLFKKPVRQAAAATTTRFDESDAFARLQAVRFQELQQQHQRGSQQQLGQRTDDIDEIESSEDDFELTDPVLEHNRKRRLSTVRQQLVVKRVKGMGGAQVNRG